MLASFKSVELKMLGESLRDAAEKILRTVDKMEMSKTDSMVLQASVALNVYGPSIFNLAGTIESEFQDQYSAAKTGRPARWQVNQKKVEARMQRREYHASIAAGSTRPKAARKSTKKASRKRS